MRKLTNLTRQDPLEIYIDVVNTSSTKEEASTSGTADASSFRTANQFFNIYISEMNPVRSRTQWVVDFLQSVNPIGFWLI